MKLFLSWSGPKSHGIAKVLERYLPSLINKVSPWLSSSGIDSGARWSTEIAANLEASNVGIICVTPENRDEPWILFEAGAIAKQTTNGRAVVLRIGLSATDITGPLAQFQSVAIDREGIRKLVMDINKSTEEPISEASLEISFDALWPKIETELAEIASQSPTQEVKPRSVEDMLGELLELSRHQDAIVRKLLPTSFLLSEGSGKSHRFVSTTPTGVGAERLLRMVKPLNPRISKALSADIARSIAAYETLVDTGAIEEFEEDGEKDNEN